MNDPTTGQAEDIQPGQPPERARQREPLLIVMLVIGTIGTLLTIVINGEAWASMVRHNQSTYLGVVVTETFLGLVGLAAVVGVWMWRRWAVLVLGAVALIGFMIDLSVAGAALLPGLIIRVGVFGLLAYAIRRQWESFA